MSELLQYINDSGLYRSVFTGDRQTSRPRCLVVREKYYHQAYSWFQSAFERRPDFSTFVPGTIYYDDDVCYNSPNFSTEAFRSEQFSAAELKQSETYIRELRRGEKTLEKMDSYETTAAKYSSYQSLSRKICFIPLQLEDDMAVTMFIMGEQSYPLFAESLRELFQVYSDTLFIIKPHPLSKIDTIPAVPNAVTAHRSDNIHFLLDLSDVTLCYNSGVGLLSILHETPTITLGNAFYNVEGAGYRARSAEDGLRKFVSGGIPKPPRDLVIRLAAWFIFRKYSQFVATDDIKEFSHRMSHSYKNISVTTFLWRDNRLELGRLKQFVPFSWSSYAAARIAPSKTPSYNKANKGDSLRKRGLSDFHNGRFAESAKSLVEAYKLTGSKPNTLRYAAEAYSRAGDRPKAVSIQTDAVKAQPHIVRAKLRLLTLKFPALRHIMGTWEIKVPRT